MLSSAPRRDTIIGVCLTRTTRDTLKAQASAEGVTLSSYCRAVLEAVVCGTDVLWLRMSRQEWDDLSLGRWTAPGSQRDLLKPINRLVVDRLMALHGRPGPSELFPELTLVPAIGIPREVYDQFSGPLQAVKEWQIPTLDFSRFWSFFATLNLGAGWPLAWMEASNDRF